MAQMVTLELSDSTVRRAQETAQHTGRSVEAVLSEWIERSALAEELSPLIPGVAYPIYTIFGGEGAARALFELLKSEE